MNYNDLNHIVKHIKKEVSCSECSKKYLYDDIEVLSTYMEQALIVLNCFHCKNEFIFHVSIMERKNKKGITKEIEITKQNSINVTEQELQQYRSGGLSQISSNDVINIHQFLDNFDGDFKKLFTPNK